MPTADGVLGAPPTYLGTPSSDVPNLAALGHRIWTPALDEGFVPQGLTSSGAFLYVSSYKPTPDLKSNTGPCRVFRIEKASGRITGGFDIPAGTCTHSGGLAYAGDGKLFLADTRQLFLVDLEKALASGTSAGASRAVKITGELRGSYATFDGKDLWIGTWTKEERNARMFPSRSAPVRRPRRPDGARGPRGGIDPVPVEAQGAAFDKSGTLWVSASTGSWGKLYRLSRQGQVQAEYAMVAGLEDLTVDDDGRLWGLSESGTRKYIDWQTKFPYIFQIDTTKLR
jgi:hypothetical protein